MATEFKEIDLTRGKVALVDEGDYRNLIQWNWSAKFIKGKWYAARHFGTGKEYKREYMHRAIMSVSSGMEVDHRDGDGLNNTRKNLRICTHAQNLSSMKKRKDNKSGYKGVCWSKPAKKYVSYIRVNDVAIHLGCFVDPIEAAKKYDEAAKKYFGEFAKTNF